jgi:hypothetical protein
VVVVLCVAFAGTAAAPSFPTTTIPIPTIGSVVRAATPEVAFPGVVFKVIEDPDALIEIALAWLPGLEDASRWLLCNVPA